MRLATLILCALFLTGCGVRLSDAQAKQLAQAKADAAAAAKTTDAAARSALLGAFHNRILAGLADLDLPPPETPPEALVEPDGAPIMPAVEREAQEAKAAADEPPSGMLGAVLAGAGGVGLAALAWLRFSPGAFGLVANIAHTLLAPKATRDMRAAAAKAQDVAGTAMAYGHALTTLAVQHGLGDKVEAVKAQAAAVQDRLGIRDQVDAILAGMKAGNVPTLHPPAPAQQGATT